MTALSGFTVVMLLAFAALASLRSRRSVALGLLGFSALPAALSLPAGKAVLVWVAMVGLVYPMCIFIHAYLAREGRGKGRSHNAKNKQG